MRIIEYSPQGVCSRLIKIEYDENKKKIINIVVLGGCNGNLKGISSLLKNMDINEAIKKLEGIRCGSNTTSCPDQIAKALKKCLS